MAESGICPELVLTVRFRGHVSVQRTSIYKIVLKEYKESLIRTYQIKLILDKNCKKFQEEQEKVINITEKN